MDCFSVLFCFSVVDYLNSDVKKCLCLYDLLMVGLWPMIFDWFFDFWIFHQKIKFWHFPYNSTRKCLCQQDFIEKFVFSVFHISLYIHMIQMSTKIISWHRQQQPKISNGIFVFFFQWKLNYSIFHIECNSEDEKMMFTFIIISSSSSLDHQLI